MNEGELPSDNGQQCKAYIDLSFLVYFLLVNAMPERLTKRFICNNLWVIKVVFTLLVF